MRKSLLFTVGILGAGLILFLLFSKSISTLEQDMLSPFKKSESSQARTEFSGISASYRFSAVIPSGWQVEYISPIKSISLFDPSAPEESQLAKSRIFIRFFEASDFETLPTVNIITRDETSVDNHDAVRYEIAKKPTALGFPYQPPWRNEQHEVTDVRFALPSEASLSAKALASAEAKEGQTNPSLFYVFARNPALLEDVFNNFLKSIKFHNDPDSFVAPLSSPLPAQAGKDRITKKEFGTHVSPANSPVQPEKFSGYHTGVDFEIFLGEETIDIPVSTICGGKLLVKKYSQGYGGVAVQECVYKNQPITVIYGHVKLASVTAKVGAYLPPGTPLGILGKGYSPETDGERKHLHLAIHQGPALELRGYAQSQGELSAWMDPMMVLK